MTQQTCGCLALAPAPCLHPTYRTWCGTSCSRRRALAMEQQLQPLLLLHHQQQGLLVLQVAAV